jgi:hypothetical protein
MDLDTPERTNRNGSKGKLLAQKPESIGQALDGNFLDTATWKSFFRLTGGSVLYCLSAVAVAYGIVNMMRPILAESKTLREALPCIFTLQVYEIALLGVLVLIVSKKVIDDAISLTILVSIFLIGTSMALGSVADKDITMSLYVGLAGIGLALGKFQVMLRFARIPFRILSFLGLGILVICNYLGPNILARSLSVEPANELARRSLWLFILLIMLLGAGLVIIEAVRRKQREQQDEQTGFLQRPVMVYVFALIIVIASGVHQYTMAFTFALERVLGDYVPVIAVATLLLVEIFRRCGKRFGFIEIVISCMPLAVMMLAIQRKSVLATSQLNFGLICYPSVLLGLFGLALAGLAMCHRWNKLFYVVFVYFLGVILTFGFSPEYPHDLNIHICLWTVVISLLFYGIIIRNQYISLAGFGILCFELSLQDAFSTFVLSYNVTEAGGLLGVGGLGCMALYLFFGQRFNKAIRIIGAICLAVFVYEYLPTNIHWRYLIILIGTGLLAIGLWYRARDTRVRIILSIPYLMRLYIVAKQIAYWRFVILGFLLLGVGTIVSLLKHPKKGLAGED